jgi:hypothetical protein
MNLKKIYAISRALVIREVGEELLIIPTVLKEDTSQPVIFTISKTGRAVLDKIDGKKTLDNIIEELALSFSGSRHEIEQDVFRFINELKKRDIISNIDDE